MNTIYDYAIAKRIIDGHEHICTQDMRREWQTDFFGILHYFYSDLVTAGMKRQALNEAQSDEEKATIFLTYWQKAKNTTYGQMVRVATEDLYGMNNWTVPGILDLNEQVRSKTYDQSWYHHVLSERAGIDMTLTLIQRTDVDDTMFRPVMFFDPLIMVKSCKDIETNEAIFDHAIHSFGDYVQLVESAFSAYVKEGIVAAKIGVAYERSLYVSNPSYIEAESQFHSMLRTHASELSGENMTAIQDYLIHKVIQLAASIQLPIQIHTGHHEPSVTGNGNIITNSRVSDLIPLLLQYPEATFVLLHGGYPYYAEYLSICKNFPNVYADLTWLYIISPTATQYILHQLIDMVPQNKILAFGGDYNQVELAYAHAKLARSIIAKVLSERVTVGQMSEQDAISFLDMTLYDNLNELYKLNL